MKKLLTLLVMLIALLCIPLTVSAERDDWKDENFDFKHLKNVIISSISILPVDRSSYTPDFEAKDTVMRTLATQLKKRGLKVYTVSDISQGKITGQEYPSISIVVHGLGKYIVHQPPYDEEKTVDKKEVGKDEHGKDIVVTVPTKEIVHHPAKDIWHAISDLEFTVTKGDKQIYTVRDNRERSSETDTSGMLGRICKEFSKDITKN